MPESCCCSLISTKATTFKFVLKELQIFCMKLRSNDWVKEGLWNKVQDQDLSEGSG